MALAYILATFFTFSVYCSVTAVVGRKLHISEDGILAALIVGLLVILMVGAMAYGQASPA